MDSIDSADRLAAARRRLEEVWADSCVNAFARRCAGDPQLADDARQSAYCAMIRLPYLDQIENLRAYFCRVLIRQVYRERAQLGAVLVQDFAQVADEHGGASAAFEDAVCASVQASAWHKRLIRARDALTVAVPARSHDPRRYRAVIYAAAEQVLRDVIAGEPSEADANDAFRVAYPEYFGQPGTSTDACHQRFRRARTDVRQLLRAVAG